MPTPLAGWTKLQRYHADGVYLIALDTDESGKVDLTTDAAQYLATLPNSTGGRDEFSPLFNLDAEIVSQRGEWCQATVLGATETEDAITTFRVSTAAWRVLEGIPVGVAAPQELL